MHDFTIAVKIMASKSILLNFPRPKYPDPGIQVIDENVSVVDKYRLVTSKQASVLHKNDMKKLKNEMR